MPNKNYQAGRRFEHEVMKLWREKGYAVTRAAGSKSEFDVIAYRFDRPVELLQCKRTKAVSSAKLLLDRFRQNPPILPSEYFHQVMVVKVKGSSEILSVTL